jgi:hypothetical protein
MIAKARAFTGEMAEAPAIHRRSRARAECTRASASALATSRGSNRAIA